MEFLSRGFNSIRVCSQHRHPAIVVSHRHPTSAHTMEHFRCITSDIKRFLFIFHFPNILLKIPYNRFENVLNKKYFLLFIEKV